MPYSPPVRRLPERFACAHAACGRNLVVADARTNVPPGADAARVHRRFDPARPPFALCCPCGHYTAVTPWRSASATAPTDA